MGSCMSTPPNPPTPEPSPLFEKNKVVVFDNIVYQGTILSIGNHAYTVQDANRCQWRAPKEKGTIKGTMFPVGTNVEFVSDTSQQFGSCNQGPRYLARSMVRV